MDEGGLDRGDKAHQLTTTIYKELQSNFSNGLRNIFTTGRALHKALEASSLKAKAHYDAISILGQTASQSVGTVHDVGEALMQMAGVYKEIQKQIDENIAALKKELCNPVEFVLIDNGTKMEDRLKSYNKEHSRLVIPYKKAATNLHKYRKKSKGNIQNPKEMQYFREANESKTKLDRYRLKSLREALSEEKSNYNFAISHLLNMVRHNAAQSRKAQEMLTHRLSDWSQVAKKKEIGEEGEKILESVAEENANGNAPNAHIAGGDTGSNHSGSSQRFGNIPTTLSSSSSSDKPRVKALYNHSGEGNNQLAFKQGDILILHGEMRDGWHYGINTRTKKYGWFPISFTESLRRRASLTQDSSGSSSNMSRARSLADLTGDDATPLQHFQFPTYSPEDRSTMTLPHKKTNSSSMAGGRPFGMSPSQMEQLARAQQWISTQMLHQGVDPALAYYYASQGNLAAPPSSPIQPQQFGDYVNNFNQMFANHQHPPQESPPLAPDQPADPFYQQQLHPQHPPPQQPIYHDETNGPMSPPLPPPPPDMNGQGRTGMSFQAATLPNQYRNKGKQSLQHNSSPTSPPPPPPPVTRQSSAGAMILPPPPGQTRAPSGRPGASQISPMSQSNSGVPPPPPLTSMPRSSAGPPPPPPGGPPPPKIGGGIPPPPPPPPVR